MTQQTTTNGRDKAVATDKYAACDIDKCRTISMRHFHAVYLQLDKKQNPRSPSPRPSTMSPRYCKLLSHVAALSSNIHMTVTTRMWANAQRDGRPAEHRWRPLFNAAKFG